MNNRKHQIKQEPEKCRKGNCDICKLETWIYGNWIDYLGQEIKSTNFKNLKKILHTELYTKNGFFPPPKKIFYFTKFTKLEDIKVVIIGQDPYPNKGQAMGLAFSVSANIIKIPCSLKNIFKELSNDIEGFTKPKSGNLTKWAKQGVLLLNEVLTTEPKRPGSHSKRGWEKITSEIVALINHKGQNVVFMLWGAKAQTKKSIITNKSKHLILECPHPSGLSAYRGFFGCKHFSKANKYLKKWKKEPIDWKLD